MLPHPMRRRLLAATVACAFTALSVLAFAGSSPEQLKKDLGDEGIVGEWHYDDIPGGLADAKRSGRPVLVVFR